MSEFSEKFIGQMKFEREKSHTLTQKDVNILSSNIMKILHPDYRTIPGDSQFFTCPGNFLLPQSIKEIKKKLN